MCRRNGRPSPPRSGPALPRACEGRHDDFPRLATGKPREISPNGRASPSRGSRNEIPCVRVSAPVGDYVSTTQLRFLLHQSPVPSEIHAGFRYIIARDIIIRIHYNFIYTATFGYARFPLFPAISGNNHRCDLFPSTKLFFAIVFRLSETFFWITVQGKKFKSCDKISSSRWSIGGRRHSCFRMTDAGRAVNTDDPWTNDRFPREITRKGSTWLFESFVLRA